jgi:outer membrane lipoprotein LolB
VLRFALCVAAAFLGACAALPEHGLAPPGGFELSGRVAVRAAKDSGSARIFWRHSSDADEMVITSPVGQGIARITREGERYRLVTGDKKEFRASDAETLTERALGWRLPLSGLSDWVQGRASASGGATGEAGEGMELRQDGWKVVYEEYRDGRPLRMKLSREDIEIRLVVDRWSK